MDIATELYNSGLIIIQLGGTNWMENTVTFQLLNLCFFYCYY